MSHNNPWHKPKNDAHAPAALIDIMSEQKAEDFLTEDNLDDYELALKLQFEEDLMNSSANQEVEDRLFAELLQHREDSSGPSKYPLPTDTARFDKVEIRRFDDDFYSESSTVPTSTINSSAYHAAVMLEKNLELSKPERLEGYARHDPLLRSLNTSKALSELEGVGDLTGDGLLVNKDVGNSIRQFVQKNNNKSSKKPNHNNTHKH